jgi:RHS repeat-associated protein
MYRRLFASILIFGLALLPLSLLATCTAQRGSIRQMTDSSGKATYSASYDPYGQVIDQSSASASTHGYTGAQTDETGLLDLRARYYDPGLGTFLTQDPAGAGNPYAYANGNPISLTDPTGKWAEDPLGWLGSIHDGLMNAMGDFKDFAFHTGPAINAQVEQTLDYVGTTVANDPLGALIVLPMVKPA